MSLPRGDCLFCGTELGRGRAREHIFPQWLLRNFNAAATTIEPTHLFLDEQRVVSARRSTFAGLIEGRVCSACNNGWMSELEVQVAERLLALAAAQERLSDLEDEDR